MSYPNLGVPDAVQAGLAAASSILSSVDNTVSISDTSLPWQAGGSNINSKFFQSIQIDSGRWDQLFPYRLLVIDATNNSIVRNNKGSLIVPNVQVTVGTGSALITFEPPNSSWIFTLPITPQQLTIQDQYAIQTSATLRGVLEEHNGIRFKTVSAQGTMGVWSQRSNINKPPGTPNLLQSLFGGTLSAIGNVVNQVTNVINTATGNHPSNKPTSLRPETSTTGSTGTGYYQALKLQQFLEQYAEAKRDPKNASWRLVFDIPKQNQSFVVSPVVYNWLQNVNKPMEISYNLQLKAWRRVNLNVKPDTQKPDNQPISPGILQRILNTISQAQQTLSASINLIGSVRSDVNHIFDVIRQTRLFVKSLSGIVTTAADLPSQIAADFQSAISSSVVGLGSTIKNTSSDPKVLASLQAITNSSNQFEGLSISAVTNGQLGSNAATSQSLNSANNIFSQPNANFSLLDTVPLSSLSLTNAQQVTVENVITTASETTVAELKEFRAVIQDLAVQLSDNFGAGSVQYNEIYGLPPPTPRIQPMTLDEYEILKSLYDTMATYDILTATTTIDDQRTQSNMEYVAGLATTDDVTFSIPTSKVLAPVPFGLTIEGIAARYLGDPQRWLEIATLNNLREPYIDEDGFQLSLLSNASGRQLTVNSDTDLYIGQRIIVRSSTQSPSARVILGIDRLSDTSFLLTLDGLPDLDNFTTTNSAYIQAYLPGTCNSQQKIFIPSDLPVPPDSSIIPPPGTTNDPLTGLSKVDWLLQDNGDLAVNNYGDFRYSSGITNIVQALRIKFGTQAGTVLLHKNFGLNVKVGTISSELQIQELFNSINNMVTQDPRFTGVSKLQINLNGTTLGISCAISLPGQTGVFPISFALSV